MVSAVRIIPVSFHFLRRDRNVSSVLPAPCIDLAVDVLDVGRIAVSAVAAAEARIIRHVPGRIEFFVQPLILGWVLAMNGAVSRLLRLDRRGGAEENDRAQELAWTVQDTGSRDQTFGTMSPLQFSLTRTEPGTTTDGRVRGVCGSDRHTSWSRARCATSSSGSNQICCHTPHSRWLKSTLWTRIGHPREVPMYRTLLSPSLCCLRSCSLVPFEFARVAACRDRCCASRIAAASTLVVRLSVRRLGGKLGPGSRTLAATDWSRLDMSLARRARGAQLYGGKWPT